MPRIAVPRSHVTAECWPLREWSVPDAVRALMTHAAKAEAKGLPAASTLKRRWHEWEAGDSNPSKGEGFYAPIIARTLALPAMHSSRSSRASDSQVSWSLLEWNGRHPDPSQSFRR